MKVVEFGDANKESIVLLHGGGLSWWNYRDVIEELQRRSDAYHIILPILDGHNGAEHPFTSLNDTAKHVISYIDEHCGGHVCVLGGLSLGAQIVVEILSIRKDICSHALIESALVERLPLTNALLAPSIHSSYGLINKRWFAKLQFKSLHMKDSLFEDYFRDSSAISEENMIAMLKANSSYELPNLENVCVKTMIFVGGKERGEMLRSARKLHEVLVNSELEILDGYNHGDLSMKYPNIFVDRLEELIHL